MKKSGLAAVLLILFTNSAGAQTPLRSDPEASRLTQAFIDALRVCGAPNRSAVDMFGSCAGTKFGMLEAYLIAAGRCHQTRTDADCIEAQSLRKYVTQVLEISAKH